MKILHLCSAYILNNLYKELFEAIDSLGIEQDIYIPIKTNINFKEKDKSKFKNADFFIQRYLLILTEYCFLKR